MLLEVSFVPLEVSFILLVRHLCSHGIIYDRRYAIYASTVSFMLLESSYTLLGPPFMLLDVLFLILEVPFMLQASFMLVGASFILLENHL